jgi:low molecular weight protein-tyrosine phosphatase
MSKPPVTSVLFVCLGNICRSPTAHGVFETLRDQRALSHSIEVDSCGTGAWHVGEPPDRRATAEARKRGYDLSHLRARQVEAADFDRFHYILAMDRQNLADLQSMCPVDYAGHLGLFLPFAGAPAAVADEIPDEVPDPYYGGDEGFARVLDMVERASEGLLREIRGADTAR